MNNVSIFVDVQNIYYTVKESYKSNFDYNTFWSKATYKRKVVKAIAYAIHSKDDKRKQFHNILREIALGQEGEFLFTAPNDRNFGF